MSLKFAHLSYGGSLVLVEPCDACPIPQAFDFDDPEACARKIFAIMSAQSGGFTLTDCTLRYDQARRCANLTAKGAHVYYQDESAPKFTVDEAVAYAANFPGVMRSLGHVRSAKSLNGWEHALWHLPNQPTELQQRQLH